MAVHGCCDNSNRRSIRGICKTVCDWVLLTKGNFDSGRAECVCHKMLFFSPCLIPCHLMIDRQDLACYAKCHSICAGARCRDPGRPPYFESRRTEPTATRSEARSAACGPAPGLIYYIREVHQTIASKVICHRTIPAATM